MDADCCKRAQQSCKYRCNKGYQDSVFDGADEPLGALHVSAKEILIKLSREKVLLLHQLLAEETGGSIGVRDIDLLESAINNAYNTFGGEELYKTKEEKAASLGFSLISNHAFVDGNKRIGVYVMLTFLEAEGIKMDCSNADVVELGLSVASGKMKYAEVLNWINKFKK